MARQSDAALEKRVDGYIDRIAVAQASEPNGYIDTYTQLMEADHQWGERGRNAPLATRCIQRRYVGGSRRTLL